ncbi:MAG: NYN domain-containing protein [Cypionkella sp.]|nr:NYN domain-containing protein [Cypionkella sp.]
MKAGVSSGATVLLVDGENIPQSLAGQIILKTRHFGRAMVQRVYGDMARLTDWEKTPSFEAVHTSRAKNSADMRICIDAMDLVHRGGVGRVVIVSSDRDFTHLAQNLRAKGCEVVGMGMAHAAASFRFACSQFIELAAEQAKPSAAKPAPQARPNISPNAASTIKYSSGLVKAEGKAGMP